MRIKGVLYLQFLLIGVLNFTLSACSFQSKQWNLVKSLVSSESSLKTEPNWQLVWQDYTLPMYLIVENDRFIFTDAKALIVWFDGWNIYRIESLPYAPQRVDITYRTSEDESAMVKPGERSRNDGGGNIGRLAQPFVSLEMACQKWQKQQTLPWVRYVQSCSLLNDVEVVNRIDLDEGGMISVIEIWLSSDISSGIAKPLVLTRKK